MTTCYSPPMSGRDNNLLQFVASTVETLRQRIDTMSEQMATKVDLANLKDYMEEKMATKEDLARLEASTNERFAQVDSRFAQVDARFDSLDSKTTAIRGDIEQVHMRLDAIDRGVKQSHWAG